MREVQSFNGNARPVGWERWRFIRKVLFVVCFWYETRCLNIGIKLHDLGILPGHIVKYTGELVNKTQQGNEITNHKQFAGHPMLVNISYYRYRINQSHQHIRKKPFPFVDLHTAHERGEHINNLLQQAVFHSLLQSQGDNGDNIGKAVEQCAGDDVFFFIGIINRSDERFIKLKNDPYCQYAQHHADCSKERREVKHSDK